MNFPQNFNELVENCISYYTKKQSLQKYECAKNRRQQLKPHIERFHKNSGTLNEKIKSKIESLNDDSTILLMTAHQPNLFPYSGVLRKSTLLYVLQNELEKKLGVKVVSFFGIADQDFTDDRWVKSTVLPSITKKGGLLTLNINLPEKVMLKSIPKPPHELLEKWENSLTTWVHDSTTTIRKYCLKNGLSEWENKSKIFQEDIEKFWSQTEEAYTASQTYADFNAFVMSKIVNDTWEYDTLFARFSECQTIFEKEFSYILQNFQTYSKSLQEILEDPNSKNERGVANSEPESIPFWYHCDCGGKAKLTYTTRNNEIIGCGLCINCGKKFEINLGKINDPSISKIADKISARAIPMILVFSKGLDLTCYIGGIGGKEYLKEAEYASEKIKIDLPVISYWRPNDYYLSLNNIEALLEYQKISGNFIINRWADEKISIVTKIANTEKQIEKFENRKNIISEDKKNNKISQEEFIFEIKSISQEINKIRKNTDISILQSNVKELDNIPQVFNNIPSIIDYVVNIGLNNTSKQWIKYLETEGSLISNLKLKSNLDNIKIFDENINEMIYEIWKDLKK
jgi:hypothetical protein